MSHWFPGHEPLCLFAYYQFTLALLCSRACGWRSSLFSTFFTLKSVVLLPHYKVWELSRYPTSHKHFYKYCFKPSSSIFNLLQSGFYFLYKFLSSLKALLPSFGEVFSVWSFCLFLQLSVHSEFQELLSSCGYDRSFFRSLKFYSLHLPKEWKRQAGEQEGTDSATPRKWDIKSCILSRGGKHGRKKTERQRWERYGNKEKDKESKKFKHN